MKLTTIVSLWPPFGGETTVVTPPTSEGVRLTLPVNRCHFTLPKSRAHATMPVNRLHYVVNDEE